ncbi:putative RNA polymerase II subunit B1 CTD phosphatase RPAP2 isoform X2 [Pecten maximus]|uniref:putative RNA polymerase II subunit B1 CTD phosphatase RPAP2 isoform X2 n=1 Tax=Pecten maximus TaxID=6579 RepID=UPI001458B357|nr:putative RNA polymerase II subunit B1 CTD phosphatase RPAP2 isoform X2 [Pecten maximus]
MKRNCTGLNADDQVAQSDIEAERRKKVEHDLRRRQECEKRAFHIVEKMLDGPVAETSLLQDALHICPNHYDDIIEERAIAKLCGYPICQNPLGQIPKQKYHISTRSNKVYDITARKNFCSNQCFTASQYFRRQLLTAPLWTREHMPNKGFKLLSLGATSGLEGDEVISVTPEIRKEVQSLERLEKYETKSKDKPANKSPNDPDQINLQSLRISDNTLSSNKNKNSSVPSTHQENISVAIDEKKVGNKDDSSKINNNDDSQVKKESGDAMTTESKMKYLELLLSKRKHLLGKMADIQPMKLSKDSDDDEDSASGADHHGNKNPTKESYKTPCSESGNVNVNSASDSDDCQDSELQGDIRTSPVLNKPSESHTQISHSTPHLQAPRLKPPDKTPKALSKSVIKILCQTLKQWVTKETIELISPQESDTPHDGIDETEFQLKYTKLCQRIDARENDLDDLVGESRIEDSSFPEKPVPNYSILKEETEEFGQRVAQYLQGKTNVTGMINEVAAEKQSEVHLPTVDSHDQMLIRKKIVMEKLNHSMPELLVPLKLSMQEVFSEVRQLVLTFSLSNQNILFRPAEWTLVCLILIKILARRHHHIADSFKEESAVRYFDILLHHLGESPTTVDQHISQIILTALP